MANFREFSVEEWLTPIRFQPNTEGIEKPGELDHRAFGYC